MKHFGFQTIYIFLLTTMLLVGCAELTVASDGKNVMILNSDASIVKYSTAQTAFSSTIERNCIEVDMGNKWIEINKIKKTIIDEDPDIIYCVGSKAFQLAQDMFSKKKIIFSLSINWKRFKLNKKTFGVSYELKPEMQLMMFRYLFPEIKNLGVVYSDEFNKEWTKYAKEGGKDVGFNILNKPVNKKEDVIIAMGKLLPEIDALWLIPDPVVLSGKDIVDKIFNIMNKVGKPILSYNDVFVNRGAVLSISPDIATIGRQAGGIAKDFLENLEIENKVSDPAGTNIVLNMKQVDKYGIKLNIDALSSVNKIIE